MPRLGSPTINELPDEYDTKWPSPEEIRSRLAEVGPGPKGEYANLAEELIRRVEGLPGLRSQRRKVVRNSPDYDPYKT